MQKMRQLRQSDKRVTEYGCRFGNKGFTLVEVLIAVVIMAIVAIPLLHAFSTTANTSAKAKFKMIATNAAENIMEDVKNLTIEEITDKYGTPTMIDGGCPDPESGAKPVGVAYEFNITSSDANYASYGQDLKDALKDGKYNAKLVIDPSYYPNINSINLSDFDVMSGESSAIYTHTEEIDRQAYKKYADLYKQYHASASESDVANAEAKFKAELKREIRIDIEKKGEMTDGDGNTIDKVEVKVTTSYYLDNNRLPDDSDDLVNKGQETQKLVSRKIFSNASSGVKLNSVFVLYNPRYVNAKECGDIIIVHNRDSVKTNLYVVAQDVMTHGSEWEAYRKSTTGGLNLHIYEDEVDGEQPITLYTNLHDPKIEDYYKKGTAVIPIQCFVTVGSKFQDPEGSTDIFNNVVFNRLKNKKGTFESEDITKSLNTRDVDGKFLDTSKVEDKIYSVSVTVTKDTGADEWPVSVTLTGTTTE